MDRWLPGGNSEPVPVSDEEIALFPFQVVGDVDARWHEDLPVLLGSSLGSVPGFEPVEGQRAMRGWAEVTDAAAEPRRAVGRATAALGARWGITGRVLGRDGKLHVTALAFDAQRDLWLGPAQVSGRPDSLFSLVDRLTLALLEEGVLPGRGARMDGRIVPDLRGVTTASLPALRAFLRGESRYRRGRWDRALPHYHEAVEADPRFGLALYRLGVTYDWMGRGEAAGQYYRAALERPDRLRARERSLVRGVLLQAQRRTEAIDTLLDLVERHPNFAEGWIRLGEAYFHVGRRILATPGEYRRAFRRAVELDPSSAPAYAHLIEDAFFRGDSADAEELVSRYREAVASPPRATGYELAWRLAFGRPADVARAAVAVDTVPRGPWDTYDVVLGLLQLNPDHRTRMDSVAAAQLRRTDSFHLRWNALFHLLRAYPRAGRFREGRALLRRRMEVQADRRRMASSLLVWEAALPGGSREAEAALPVLLEAEPSPEERFWIGVHALRSGKEPLLSEQQAALQATGVPPADLLAEALWGLTVSRQGDSLTALRLLAGVQGKMADGGTGDRVLDYLRFELGELYLSTGDPRTALRHFLAQNHYADLYVARRELALARTYEALGDRGAAVEHYARFARWWEDCDPEGRALVDEAERALRRLR